MTFLKLSPPDSQFPSLFEKLCADVLGPQYGIRFDSFHGRGARQYGIDLYGYGPDNERIAIQARNRTAIRISQIIDIVEKAESITLPIDELWIVAGCDPPADIEDQVREITKARRAASKFRVRLIPWRDMAAELRLRRELLEKFDYIGSAEPAALDAPAEAGFGCYFCHTVAPKGALVCRACGADIVYGATLDEVKAVGALGMLASGLLLHTVLGRLGYTTIEVALSSSMSPALMLAGIAVVGGAPAVFIAKRVLRKRVRFVRIRLRAAP